MVREIFDFRIFFGEIMAEKRRDSLNIIIDQFQSSGYVIEEAPASSILRVPTVRGQLIRCIDPRVDSKTHPELLGPAVPGGIIGLAFLMEDSARAKGILARLSRAMARVAENGFVPSVHGDLEHGEVKGCKLLYALTQKVLPGVNLTEDEILGLIRSNGIDHQLLVGRSNPIGFAINMEPDTTIIPKREKYVTDGWFLDRYGLDAKNYAPKLVAIADLILAQDKRKLIVAAAA